MRSAGSNFPLSYGNIFRTGVPEHMDRNVFCGRRPRMFASPAYNILICDMRSNVPTANHNITNAELESCMRIYNVPGRCCISCIFFISKSEQLQSPVVVAGASLGRLYTACRTARPASSNPGNKTPANNYNINYVFQPRSFRPNCTLLQLAPNRNTRMLSGIISHQNTPIGLLMQAPCSFFLEQHVDM